MQKLHVKKGDVVVILAGVERGKRGRILHVLREQGRVIVEGAKIIKKHTRKSQLHPNGAIVQREGTIHASNVMLAERYDAREAKRSQAAPAT